jgi:hypothetical protein
MMVVVVMMVMMMPMPFDHDHRATVMMLVMMVLGELHAFDGRHLCQRCVVGIQRRYGIGNRRQ